MNAAEYYSNIKKALKTYDIKSVERICNEFVRVLYKTDDIFEIADLEKIIQDLRDNRLFPLLQHVGNALIQTERSSSKIISQYAQALIDQDNLIAAISILKDLELETRDETVLGNKKINLECKGLLGRAYKQVYVDADNPNKLQNQNFLKTAIQYYYGGYLIDPDANTWHGINVVTLLKRAKADGIDFDQFPDEDVIAQTILDRIETLVYDQQASAWDFSTAAEACIALGKASDALEWMSGYVRMPYVTSFQLASTLRQLEEVWQLTIESESGLLLLPLLRSKLLEKEGGSMIIDAQNLKDQKDASENILQKYESIKKDTKSDTLGITLEKVFGEDSFKTYKWYAKGSDRCLAVARLGRDSSKGFGTGFLLKGKALHESLGNELVLITNAHVVSNDPAEKSLRPEEVTIIFEALSRDEEFKPSEIIWSSPSTALDVSILRFSADEHERLLQLTEKVEIYPVSKYLPVIDEESPSQRIYIIGHPFGGTLQLSFQDNVLLDHEDPKIHYRTPTEGGSSGSPVFNQQWDLIGLHHAGSAEMRCLNNKPGEYEANEGIWIESIKREFSRFLDANPIKPI
ncbi:DUF4071 domain-containing protein [Pedobacter chinensis]|uniref:Serine protease n=1 Tax=Pedobacter chinensis TaxID=2282421 RepID=A0A369Q081_9SPHI|nr:TRAFs-binding domain-containing protein [Pedobacter chinensis]RDC57902.1 DUF4071 domain-containing protein [Pedobacter chinensis]